MIKDHWEKAFIFADMNAFFASIEQMDNPNLRGKPVAVTNGHTGTCIITCSYEARAYGVKTGYRLQEAKQLCPHLIRRASRPERYVQISTRIMKSLEHFTPELEIFSVDECFLDVTRSQHLFGSPATIAKQVKDMIYSVSGVKASIGVADSKLVAKWAAKLETPDGLTVIAPKTAKRRMVNVPVTDICGINRGVANHLAQYNAFTCGDVAKLPMNVLTSRWGNVGKRLHMICNGYDPEPIINHIKSPKSIGHGKVMPPNTRDLRIIETYLLHMCFKVATRLRLYDYVSGHFFVGVKVKSGWHRGKYKTVPTNQMMDIYQVCLKLLSELPDETSGKKGISQVQVTALDLSKQGQADLFLTNVSDTNIGQLNTAVDSINKRFGELAISPARLIHRSSMPNVIAPSWKPHGHRETILSGKYDNAMKEKRKAPFQGYIN